MDILEIPPLVYPIIHSYTYEVVPNTSDKIKGIDMKQNPLILAIDDNRDILTLRVKQPKQLHSRR